MRGDLRPVRAEPGGIRGLAGVLADRWELVEADFQRFYGLDLRAEFARQPLRRVSALVSGLPADAVTWRQDGWPVGDELLATLIEVTDSWSRALFELAAGEKSIQVPGPIEIRRPGSTAETPAPRAETDPNVVAAFFRKHT